MKRYIHWRTCCLLVLLALSVQGCLGFGGGGSSTSFKTTNTKNGQIGVNDQVSFKGKIYFTQGHNLYVLDGSRVPRLLLSGGNIYDPSISPDGKTIAYIVKTKNYSNLMLAASDGTHQRRLIFGDGHFVQINGNWHDTFSWYAQPIWSADGKTLMFLSDLEKDYWSDQTLNAPMLDLQIFSVEPNHANMTGEQLQQDFHQILNYPYAPNSTSPVKEVAYASYGDGGDRDPGYRPGHPDQVIYTHYAYAHNQTDQNIQIFMEDPNAIPANETPGSPGKYHPGVADGSFDPGIAITPQDKNVANTQPAFSPDGNHIAYIHTDNTTNTMGLYVMSTPENITQTPNDKTTQANALKSYKKASLIVSGQFVSQPVWSSDGTQIAYFTYTNGTFDIWLANVKVDAKTGQYKMAGSSVQLTNGGVDGDARPYWTT